LATSFIAGGAGSSSGGTLRGTAFTADGVPMAGALVQAADIMRPSAGMLLQAHSDAAGNFIIATAPGFGATTVQLWAQKPEDFFPALPGHFYTMRPPTLIHTDPGGSASRIAVYLAPQCGRLLGTVSDAGSGAPIVPQISMWREGNPKSDFGTAGSLKGDFDVLVPTVAVVLYIRAAGYRDWYYPGTSIAARARPLKVSARQTLKLRVIMQKLP